jgi:hypothetical protein
VNPDWEDLVASIAASTLKEARTAKLLKMSEAESLRRQFEINSLKLRVSELEAELSDRAGGEK